MSLIRAAVTRLAPSLCAVIGLLVFCVPLAQAEAQIEPGWELQKDDDGIQLYTRKIAQSPFLEVKATTRISATMEKLTAVFGDGSGCAAWRNNCKASKVLRAESEQERYIYMVLDLPWPVSDRDLVVRSLSSVDAEARLATVDVTSVEGEHPEQDYVRAISRAQYLMHMVEPNEIDLTYTVHVDLGGNLSPGMINSQLASSTFKEIEQLVKLAES